MSRNQNLQCVLFPSERRLEIRDGFGSVALSATNLKLDERGNYYAGNGDIERTDLPRTAGTEVRCNVSAKTASFIPAAYRFRPNRATKMELVIEN